MSKFVRDVMSSEVVVFTQDATIVDAARAMRDRNVGDVIVCDDHGICGIVTDRDIVVRALAETGLTDITLGDICSRDLALLEATDTVDAAISVIRDRAVRRLPVVDHDQPIGVVSLGDLAIDRDPDSVLGTVSRADPNC